VISYLRLVRLPNVFTALADIAAGHLIVKYTFSGSCLDPLPWLGLASGCLYLAGMALNDVADREEDARVRPSRPIPSGAVALRGAVLCGVGLLVVGVVAAMAAGTASLYFALFLALGILLYDFATKKVALAGPLTLGLCRFFNVQLGMSADPNFPAALSSTVLWTVVYAPALAVGIYAAGMTVFSAQEEAGKQARSVVLGWVFVGGALMLAGLTAQSSWIWLALGLLAAVLAWRTAALLREGSPTAARNLVKTGVLGVCVLDAGLILGCYGLNGWPFALAVACGIIPALLIGKALAQKEA